MMLVMTVSSLSLFLTTLKKVNQGDSDIEQKLKGKNSLKEPEVCKIGFSLLSLQKTCAYIAVIILNVWIDRSGQTVVPDQTKGAVWSGSTLFGNQSAYFWCIDYGKILGYASSQ